MIRPQVTRGATSGAVWAIARPATRLGRVSALRRAAVAPGSASTLPAALGARAYATAKATTAKAATAKAAAKKPKAKTAKKAAPKKPRKKKVVKPKKVARKPRKVLSDLEKKKLRIKDLRLAALLDTPSPLSSTGYSVYLSETIGKNKSTLGEAAAQWKTLSDSQKQRHETTAEGNKAENVRQLEAWVKNFTPLQIKEANRARRILSSYADDAPPAAGKRKLVGKKLPQLPDSRQIKSPLSPYTSYVSERLRSGTYKGVPVTDAMKRISEEWKALGSAESQKYRDAYERGVTQYQKDYEQLYGRLPPKRAVKKVAQ